MPQLPSGTVTFVFSDIEGSTSLLKQLGDDSYAKALATHRTLVRANFAEHGGEEIDTQGDAFFYSFTRARAAVAAAVAVQRSHAVEAWPNGAQVRIRLGLHTGEPAVGEDGYTGLDVVRASRIAATARGGQVLLSEASAAIVANHLPDGVTLRPLGARRLKDIDEPEPLVELVIPGVEVTPETPTGVVPRGRPSLPPGVSEDMPAWLQGMAGRFLPPTNKLIEERVLASIDEALRERDRAQRRPHRNSAAPASATVRRSVADEIARLQNLRESGALTEDQYQRAVDRALTDSS